MDTKFTLEDSLQLLAINYHKILRINLAEDSHTELKMYADERNTQKGYSEKISVWLFFVTNAQHIAHIKSVNSVTNALITPFSMCEIANFPISL